MPAVCPEFRQIYTSELICSVVEATTVVHDGLGRQVAAAAWDEG